MSHSSVLITGVLLVLLASPATLVYAYSWVFLGSDPIGETTPPGDITGMYFYNDGTYAYFNETLRGAPDVSQFTYAVYLDKPRGGTYPFDFRLVYSTAGSKLQKWTVSGWVDVETITVTSSTSPNSLTFKVKLSSIANPNVQQDTGVLYINTPKSMSTGKQWVNFVYGSKNTVVGNVSFSIDATNFYIEIYMKSGWKIQETHVKVSMDQFSWSAPGQWPYAHTFTSYVTYDSFTIPLSSIGHGQLGTTSPLGVGVNDAFFVMVQAAIRSTGGRQESAYASAFKCTCPFIDMAYATISHQVIPELPWPTPLVFIPAVTVAVYAIYKRRFKQRC